MGRVEVEFPSTSALKNLGLRPSAFIDIGSVWKLTTPDLIDSPGVCSEPDNSDADTLPQTQILLPGDTCNTGFVYVPNSGFKETFLGNSAKPRLSVGIGVNWVSPFGPLRIDIAKALLKQDGDETKFFSFNVGTQF
jgi:outer membrane protein insertion porin family